MLSFKGCSEIPFAVAADVSRRTLPARWREIAADSRPRLARSRCGLSRKKAHRTRRRKYPERRLKSGLRGEFRAPMAAPGGPVLAPSRIAALRPRLDRRWARRRFLSDNGAGGVKLDGTCDPLNFIPRSRGGLKKDSDHRPSRKNGAGRPSNRAGTP